MMTETENHEEATIIRAKSPEEFISKLNAENREHERRAAALYAAPQPRNTITYMERHFENLVVFNDELLQIIRCWTVTHKMRSRRRDPAKKKEATL
jgi:hypothetical protein